jgi:hypothetical protein
MNNSESGNWIKLYRQITESKIWEIKPSSWVVIWIYILLKVSFVNNNSYKKGEAHFRSVEHEALPFDITNDIWYRCLGWLEEEGMIKRRKIWRGEIITVLNYERYQNNLSSETSKTGLDPNHIQIIQPNSNEAEEEQESDTPKSYPNDIQIITSTNQEEMQSEDTLKNIRIKELKNKKNIVSYDTMQSEGSDFSLSEKEKETPIAAADDFPDFFLNEEEKEKPIVAAAGEKKTLNKAIFKLVKMFCDEVGLEFNSSHTVRKNSKVAKELLSSYTIEEIMEAVKYGKEKYIKEGEDPRHMIPHLQAVSNSIEAWRGALKAQKEQQEKVKQGGMNYGW